MTPQHDHRGSRSVKAREGRREAPLQMTKAFRRYVDAVQANVEELAGRDLEAVLTLAEEIMGHQRTAEVDRSLAAAFGSPIRQLATAVRRAGRGAVAQPALLARAIVLARTLERTAAGRRAARDRRNTLVAA